MLLIKYKLNAIRGLCAFMHVCVCVCVCVCVFVFVLVLRKNQIRMADRLDKAKQTALDAVLPFVPNDLLKVVVEYCRSHHWANVGRWKSPLITVSDDLGAGFSKVKVIRPAQMAPANWVAAFCVDSLDVAGSSWCFQCDNPNGIWFGIALRDSVPLWDSPMGAATGVVPSDIFWDSAVIISGERGFVHCGSVVSWGKDANFVTHDWSRNEPVRLDMEVRNESLFARVNESPVREIARNLGNKSRWTPYVSFSSQSADSVSVKIK